MHDEDLQELRGELAAVRDIAAETLKQARLTNGRVTALEADWWGPVDERLARTQEGWRARVREMYADHRDRVAVMRAVKWLAGFVGAQTLMLLIYGIAQIIGATP